MRYNHHGRQIATLIVTHKSPGKVKGYMQTMHGIAKLDVARSINRRCFIEFNSYMSHRTAISIVEVRQGVRTVSITYKPFEGQTKCLYSMDETPVKQNFILKIFNLFKHGRGT